MDQKSYLTRLYKSKASAANRFLFKNSIDRYDINTNVQYIFIS